VRPSTVLAPSPAENQHPDHSRSGGSCATPRGWRGTAACRSPRVAAHRIEQSCSMRWTAESEPDDLAPVLIDILGS